MSPHIKSIGVTSVHGTFPLETKRLGEYQSINQLRVTDPKNYLIKQLRLFML
uniref:Uncharacterized protein n=1 Tax=Vibrio sp. FF_286 TaxID=1652831 RepID=A0A0H3ZRG2_9VIBR|nr:hypothetical protein [Vibrio sp. FF_286]